MVEVLSLQSGAVIESWFAQTKASPWQDKKQTPSFLLDGNPFLP